MRRLMLVLALIGASVLFLGMPTSANAGNCTTVSFEAVGGSYPVWYDGAWAWAPIINNCTSVNGVDFGSGHGSPGVPPFLYDSTHAAYHFPYAGGGMCGAGIGQGQTISGCDTVYHNSTWGAGCGQPGFYVLAYYSYRIRSLPFPGTWGPWHTVGGPAQLIC